MKLQKLFFGPLLLAQGLWVRSKVPSLPEPDVRVSGTVGSGPKLSLLLLGDSSAAGVGVTEPDEALISQLLKRLSTKYQVSYRMLAKTGRTTTQMLEELEAVPGQSFDVVITALGVNDVTSQVSIKQWRELQLNLIQVITDTFKPQQIIMSGLPPVREFPALPWPLSSYLGGAADAFNTQLIAITDSLEGVDFMSLRGYPVDALAATDGFHPGPRVYELWAENIVKVILETQR